MLCGSVAVTAMRQSMTTLYKPASAQQYHAEQTSNSHPPIKPSPYRLIRLREVREMTGLSRSTIYELMNSKSRYYDATFPQQVHLTANTATWVLHEIENWIASRMAQRSQGVTSEKHPA